MCSWLVRSLKTSIFFVSSETTYPPLRSLPFAEVQTETLPVANPSVPGTDCTAIGHEIPLGLGPAQTLIEPMELVRNDQPHPRPPQKRLGLLRKNFVKGLNPGMRTGGLRTISRTPAQQRLHARGSPSVKL